MFVEASCRACSHSLVKVSTWCRRRRWRVSRCRRMSWHGRVAWSADTRHRSHFAVFTPTHDDLHRSRLRETITDRTTCHPGNTRGHLITYWTQRRRSCVWVDRIMQIIMMDFLKCLEETASNHLHLGVFGKRSQQKTLHQCSTCSVVSCTNG